MVELTGDRALVLLHVPRGEQPAIAALWAIDAAMEAVVVRASDPMLARVKLAWWREALEALDHEPPPPEPRLQAAATELLPRGLSGAAIAEIEPGWATLLDEAPDRGLMRDRGVRLFRMSASLLAAGDPRLDEAGALYGLLSAARSMRTPPAEESSGVVAHLKRHVFAGPVRPITALARLAARDLRRGATAEHEGSAGRALAVLAHRWSGRIA